MDRQGHTDHNDLVTNDLHLWSSEMLQCNDRRQARTIQHVSRIRQEVNREPQIPYLKPFQSCEEHDAGCCPTRCPDCMHNDSLSTTSLRRIILSSIRVIATSSSDGLSSQRGIRLSLPIRWKRYTYRPCSYSLEAMGEISE